MTPSGQVTPQTHVAPHHDKVLENAAREISISTSLCQRVSASSVIGAPLDTYTGQATVCEAVKRSSPRDVRARRDLFLPSTACSLAPSFPRRTSRLESSFGSAGRVIIAAAAVACALASPRPTPPRPASPSRLEQIQLRHAGRQHWKLLGLRRTCFFAVFSLRARSRNRSLLLLEGASSAREFLAHWTGLSPLLNHSSLTCTPFD